MKFNRYTKYLYLLLPFLRNSKEVVLIYQMGKVGSSSIRDTLASSQKYLPYHLHWFFPWRSSKIKNGVVSDEIYEMIENERKHLLEFEERKAYKRKLKEYINEVVFRQRLYKVVRTNQQTGVQKIIIPIRDPFTVNLSMYFQCLEQYTTVRPDSQATEKNMSTLLRDFKDCYIHSWPLTWFDKEMLKNFAIDVYKYKFDKDLKMCRIEKDNLDILIYRSDLEDGIKNDILSDFLGDEIKVKNTNVSSRKEYSRLYKVFKQSVKFSRKDSMQIANSKFAQHFYSDSELENLLDKWGE